MLRGRQAAYESLHIKKSLFTYSKHSSEQRSRKGNGNWTKPPRGINTHFLHSHPKHMILFWGDEELNQLNLITDFIMQFHSEGL